MSGTRYLARLGDRSLFPELQASVYLNHAAISPPSIAVAAAVEQVLLDYQRRGVGALGRWVEQRRSLKGRLAALLGTSADNLGLTPSTSFGVQSIALCFPWRAGDRVVLFDGEFPANVTPWQRAAELFDLEIRWVSLTPFARHPEEGLAALKTALDGARLAAVSAVQFQSGLRMPLSAIAAACHEQGAELFVDAIQGAGVVPLDVEAMGIDYLAGGAHKWLMGLEGAGFVYAAPHRVAALRPNVAGWLSHERPVAFLLEGPGHLDYDRPIRTSIDFVEATSTNAVGFAALEAAVELVEQIGVEDIFDHVGRYLDPLEQALHERGFHSLRSPLPESRSGILCVLPPDGVDVVELHRQLDAQGIASSIPNGRLRFAPHWPNRHDEVEQIVAAVDVCLKRT